jgi:hypothetical protein
MPPAEEISFSAPLNQDLAENVLETLPCAQNGESHG